MTTAQKKRAPARTTAAKKKPARKAAAKKTVSQGPPSLTAAHAKGFAAGVLAGVLVGAGGVTYLTKQGSAPATAMVEPRNQAAAASETKPRFDFFTVLPNQELDLASDVEPAAVTAAKSNPDLYVLQAGSFRLESDADQRRGELALLGFSASIEESQGDNGRWFRVYLGPFESRSKMAQARSMVAQQSIDTLLLRRPRTP